MCDIKSDLFLLNWDVTEALLLCYNPFAKLSSAFFLTVKFHYALYILQTYNSTIDWK